MDNAIEVRGLCKDYKRFQLKNVDLTLPKGYILGFIGANGAGKTTTLKSILGLVKPTSGSIRIYGKDIGELTPADREEIGVVLDGLMTPKNISREELDKIMKNIYSNWSSEHFRKMCDKASLPLRAKIDTYSKGMEMKLAIACAMSHSPKLLIMDEPTSGLDPLARSEVLDMLLDFLQDEEHSVLISSHITSDLEKVADYITFIQDGRILFRDEREAVMSRYSVLKCSNEDYADVPEEAVVSHRQTRFGTERLVFTDMVAPSEKIVLDKASIEDIMIFYSRGEEEDD